MIDAPTTPPLPPRDRKLDDLDPRFLPIVFQLLARFVEAGIPVLIVETRRSEAQHQADLASGHSWIVHSLHQDGLAMDVCPYAVWQETGDDKLQWLGSDPLWLRLGVIGEGLGLDWGGRWARRDLGHFQLTVRPAMAPPTIAATASISSEL